MSCYSPEALALLETVCGGSNGSERECGLDRVDAPQHAKKVARASASRRSEGFSQRQILSKAALSPSQPQSASQPRSASQPPWRRCPATSDRVDAPQRGQSDTLAVSQFGYCASSGRYVESKACMDGQRGASGGLAEAGRSSGQPGARSGAARGLWGASWPRSEPACFPHRAGRSWLGLGLGLGLELGLGLGLGFARGARGIRTCRARGNKCSSRGIRSCRLWCLALPVAGGRLVGGQSLPRLLELAVSKVADSTASVFPTQAPERSTYFLEPDRYGSPELLERTLTRTRTLALILTQTLTLTLTSSYTNWLPREGTNALVKQFLYAGAPDSLL